MICRRLRAKKRERGKKRNAGGREEGGKKGKGGKRQLSFCLYTTSFSVAKLRRNHARHGKGKKRGRKELKKKSYGNRGRGGKEERSGLGPAASAFARL